MLAWNSFDNLVIVALEIFNVFVGDTVLDEVVVVLQREAFGVPPRITLRVIGWCGIILEDIRTLLILGVPLKDAFPFLFRQQLISILIEPSLVIIQYV